MLCEGSAELRFTRSITLVPTAWKCVFDIPRFRDINEGLYSCEVWSRGYETALQHASSEIRLFFYDAITLDLFPSSKQPDLEVMLNKLHNDIQR